MRIGKILTATAVAFTMAGTPVLAQAVSPVSKLSVAQAAQTSRTGETMGGENQLIGGTLLIGLAAFFAAGALLFVVTDDDDEEPASP